MKVCYNNFKIIDREGRFLLLDKINIVDVIKIAMDAGEKILDIYETDFEVESKEDQSPLTLADKQSHETIVKGLLSRFDGIPILSEEGKHISYEDRRKWEYFWLVDPLDGTKEFVKRNGEFTVNIALIHNGAPVLGVIYAPILDIVYFGKEGLGSFKLNKAMKSNLTSEAEILKAAIKLPAMKNEQISAVASRSHMSKETEDYIDKVRLKFGEVSITSAGSSLKLCLVAEGKADVYPRFAPTMEWDTAAGQAIVEQAGGTVVHTVTGDKLNYNKENLLNPWFIVRRAGFTV